MGVDAALFSDTDLAELVTSLSCELGTLPPGHTVFHRLTWTHCDVFFLKFERWFHFASFGSLAVLILYQHDW